MRVRFKTEAQLLSTGWSRDGTNYMNAKAYYQVVAQMRYLFGTTFEVMEEYTKFYHPTDGWGIDPEMVTSEIEIAEDLLKRYDEEIES